MDLDVDAITMYNVKGNKGIWLPCCVSQPYSND